MDWDWKQLLTAKHSGIGVTTGDSKCYVTALVDQQDAIVYFTNSANGLSVTHAILDASLGGDHPALAWLNYDRYNPAAKNFLMAVLNNGAETALKDYRVRREKDKEQLLSEATIEPHRVCITSNEKNR